MHDRPRQKKIKAELSSLRSDEFEVTRQDKTRQEKRRGTLKAKSRRMTRMPMPMPLQSNKKLKQQQQHQKPKPRGNRGEGATPTPSPAPGPAAPPLPLRRNTTTANTATTNTNNPRPNINNNNTTTNKNNNTRSSFSSTLFYSVTYTPVNLPGKPAAMKAMKSMGMNRMLGSIRRKRKQTTLRPLRQQPT